PSTSIWEIETGESIATCQLDGDHPRALAPTGTRMAIEQDGRVVIWDTVGCRALTELSGWQKDKSNSYSVMFSADATLVATSGDNLRVWTTVDGKLAWVDTMVVSPVPVGFSAEGAVLAACADNGRGFYLWDGTDGKRLARIDSCPYDWSYSTTGRLLVSVHGRDAELRELPPRRNYYYPYNAFMGIEPRLRIDIGRGTVAISPDGARFAVTDKLGNIAFWSTRAAEPVVQFEPEGSRSRLGEPLNITFSPTGHRLLTSGDGSEIWLWNAYSGQLVAEIPTKGHAFFSADGDELIVGSNDQLSLWSVEDGRLLRSIDTKRKLDRVRAFVASPRGTTYAAHDTSEILIWSVNDGEARPLPRTGRATIRSLDYSNDGSKLAVTTANAIELWDVEDGRFTYESETIAGPITATAMSSDEARIVAIAAERVHLIDVPNQQIETFASSLGILHRVRFSPDGTSFAVSGVSGQISLVS